MPAGRDLTQRAYNDLRRQHRELPSYTSLQRVAMREGGLHAGDLVRQVIAERAQR
jgi:hypothetical protein